MILIKDRAPDILLIILVLISTFAIDYWKRTKLIKILSKSHPLYSSLERIKISHKSISITKKLNVKKAKYFDDLDLLITNESVILQPNSLIEILSNPIEISWKDIHSCSKQCGGATRYMLILDKLDIQISAGDAELILNWCWQNRIPILPSSARREWLYNGSELPHKQTLLSKLTTRKDFDYEAKRACQGY